MSQKDQKLKRKLAFDIPKLKFQNGFEQKTSKFRMGGTAVFSYTFLVNDYATSFKVKIQFDHFWS